MNPTTAAPDPRKNNDFVQFKRRNLHAVRAIARENPTAMEIFLFLSEHIDSKGAVTCSQSVLQEVTGKSRPTVWRAVKFLKDRNLLAVMKIGTANVYALNYDVVWASWNSNKKYAMFRGVTLVSKAENADIEEKLKKFKLNGVQKTPSEPIP